MGPQFEHEGPAAAELEASQEEDDALVVATALLDIKALGDDSLEELESTLEVVRLELVVGTGGGGGGGGGGAK